MKPYFHTKRTEALLATVIAVLGLAMPIKAGAAPILLATEPLTKTTTTPVLPNLMFILDRSGSMDWNYLPDWVDDNICKNTDGDYDRACGGNPGPTPPFLSPDFNGIYYNPEIQYLPPVNSAGTSWASQTSWTNVKNDAYGKQSTGSTNLVTNYPDVEWCPNQNSNSNNCLRNGNYILPGRVDGTNYDTPRATRSSGTAKVVVGTPAAPIEETRALGPHYYRIQPGEWCDSDRLTNCRATQGGNFTFPASLRWCTNATNARAATPAANTCQALRAGSFKTPRFPTRYANSTGGFVRTDIVPGATYPRAASRLDCVASSAHCTYDEEMTNFANWWTYYQTRMQTMKTATSLAFKQIDNRYRVGFIDIYGGNYLPIDTFNAGTNGVKDKWYKELFSIVPSGGTPLRSALARVGQIYAGQVGSSDPIQYSCQQNFALLTTDGYWNGDTGNNDVPNLHGTSIGNMDGAGTARPMYEGPTRSSGSLADVAKYYYDTDLRTSDLDNCSGAISDVSVCLNNVPVSGTDNNRQQHMTTFTLGLGVDGSLTYKNEYKTQTSGDYFNIANGSGAVPNWPVPKADSETAIDDLWHAAVNGRGTYFSAKNPKQLADSMNEALAAIDAKLGAGSAAATSSLNPVADDNFAYVASYTTAKWQGNLESRTINLLTGKVSETATWCVENRIDAPCASPGSLISSDQGGSLSYFCATPNSTVDTCSIENLDAQGVCKVPVPVACTGTMSSKVASDTDSRTIWMAKTVNGQRQLVNFSWDNLSTTQKNAFSSSTVSQLSQWADLSEDQKALAVDTNLVNYIRGQTKFEMRRTANSEANRDVFRYREATLGDVIDSQPAFVGKSVYRYADAGYSDFVADNQDREKTVYVGANDGMLHAFDASNGQERWAFVPSAVIPRLWRLADKNYASMHTNYVNGRPVVADVYDTVAQAWKTILVAGLGGGGRAYYALDITDPTTPSLLWEIDSTTENNLGYSYGPPIVTKKSDGTWVVLFTSGYNNINPGDGKGYLYVRNALTGAHIARISTETGGTTTPSGLAKISSYKDDLLRNNTSVAVYGGDLLGNLWRFDINANNGAGSVMKFAILKDSAGNPQPITSAPELGVSYGKRLVFVGTGKYLELGDLNLDNPQRQTLYGIKDESRTTTLENVRSVLVQQTLSATGASSSERKVSQNTVDLANTSGWFIDLPDNGERIHVDPLLDAGLLIVPSTVPSNTVCEPGGYGWLNYFNYLTGTNIGTVSQRFNAPIVGVNIFYTPDGKRQVSVVTADNPTPVEPPKDLPPGDSTLPFKGKRVIWRELIRP